MPVLASQKITERFSRNPAKPADEDVAERVFLILDERIQLRYHCREDHITASKREFLRRTEVDSKGNKIIMTADMCVSFEVGLGPRLVGRGGEEALGPLSRPSRLGGLGWKHLDPSPGSHLGPCQDQELPSRDIFFKAPLKTFPFSTKKDNWAG